MTTLTDRVTPADMLTATRTKTDRYLKTFFEEKGLGVVAWEITSSDGTWNMLNNCVVLEAVNNCSQQEKTAIANMIRRIDFANGDVNDYLKHLAQALVG